MAEATDIETEEAKDVAGGGSDQAASRDAHIVILKSGGGFFGIDIQLVQEIVLMQEITEVAGSASHVAGMTDLRGRVIPVEEFAALLGHAHGERNEDTRILVVNHGGSHIGLIVDAVTEVMLVDAGQIEDEASAGARDHDFIVGVAKMEDYLVSLIDIERLLERANEGDDADALAA